jgi:hypothetical protein
MHSHRDVLYLLCAGVLVYQRQFVLDRPWTTPEIQIPPGSARGFIVQLKKLNFSN